MRGWKPAKRDQATQTAETAGKQSAVTKAPASEDTGKPEAKQADEKGGAPAASQPGAGKAADEKGAEKTAGKPKPAPNLQERMEGLQGWLAEIERRQRRMTLIAGGAALLAVLAAAAAIAFSLITQSDSATQDDVDELKGQLDGVAEQVTQSTQGQLKTLGDTVETFDGRIAALEKRQTQVTADIASLRRQVNAAVSQANQAATQNPTQDTGTTGGGGKQP